MNGVIVRSAGICTALAGAALLLCAASISLRGWIFQERHAPLFAVADKSAARVPAATGAGAPDRPPRRGEAIARLRVARLGIETVIVEGTDPRSLSLGPGHLEGSGPPGGRDNCVIAGHRDGPFARLREALPGDVVEIAGRESATARYRIESVAIVGRNETRVLEPSPTPLLTLVTCYPFDFIGRAQQRFVVRAVLLES